MPKKIHVLTVLLCALVVFAVMPVFRAEAFWLLTPKSKTFINPKIVVKDTPAEQYEWAMSFFKNGEFQRAADEFLRLIEYYKDSDYAPEAQYYAGRAFEENGKHYFAFQNYQKTVENYPYTKRLDEIVEREFNIARIFQSKGTPKLMDTELNVYLDKAVEIYKKVVENSSFGKYADQALFNMADCYRRLSKYTEAVEAYDKIVTDYPNSTLVQEAKYQMAYTMYEASLDPDYDQESTNNAMKKFEKISNSTPNPAIAEEANKALDVLKNRKADSLMAVGAFYEKQGKIASALVYYKDVVAQFPETKAAKTIEPKISVLEKRVKK
ncbi:MAG TPA: outer membrane protein assembly factor BamD [Candidatus Omnitrophota bacterium]|nr:outer membrane protein assembly factor BamD [Candidatus Omnitrophota bacterium]HPS19462.1 outer membrane protein assembly factor BamD [Candidatus Omnitrophota bacterium]